MKKAMRETMAAAAVALLTVVAHTAAADESGSFIMIRSYQHSYITIEHSDAAYTGGILKGTQTITESSGGPFVDGMLSTVECLVYSRSSDDGIALEAPCVSSDHDGDLLHSTAHRDAGTVGTGGGAGRWDLRGGTGKYQGITGSCPYETQYLPGDWVVSISECAWSTS